MNKRMLLAIIGFLLLYAGLSLYVGWNGLQFWRVVVPAQADWVYNSLFVLLAYSFLAAMMLRRWLPYRLYTSLKLIGAYGMAILMYLLLALPLADIAYVLLRLGGVSIPAAVQIVGWPVVALLLLVLAVGVWNASRPIVRQYTVQVAKQPPGVKELRLAVASDLHLGTIIGKRHLRRLVQRVNELEPDLVLFPGDVLDDSIEPFVREEMGEVMRGLRARHGIFASLGNHEYIGGHVAEYIERMREIGIEVLTDQVVKVEDIVYIAGRKDASVERMRGEGRLAVGELLAEADKTLPIVLLDHQPRQLGAAAEAGVDLMLSGHTHRGQMTPNHLITRRLFELDWGYLRKGEMHAVVSSGFGTWGPPLRIGSRSEILEIRMIFEEGKERSE